MSASGQPDLLRWANVSGRNEGNWFASGGHPRRGRITAPRSWGCPKIDKDKPKSLCWALKQRVKQGDVSADSYTNIRAALKPGKTSNWSSR